KERAFREAVILACIAILPACSADSAGTVDPPRQIASVVVNADSSAMAFGHIAHVSVLARDAGGETVPAPDVQWTTSNPDIATVSATGDVNAVGLGVVTIGATVAGLSASTDLTIVSGPPEAFHNFDDGTLGAFINRADSDLDFVDDPTGAGRGKVARFHYQGTLDINRSLEFRYVRRYGEPIYFKGDFYLPLTDLGQGEVIRKLIYWQSHKNWGKYPPDGGFGTGRTVVVIIGSDLIVDATYNPAPSTGLGPDDVRTNQIVAQGMQGNRWYTLEVYQVMETAIGRADGVLRVWLDGTLVFDRANMTWTDPNWLTDTKYGKLFDPADIYFEHFLVGNQVNRDTGSFDEIRYWDNVELSTLHGH
ncbi:MAG TPA: Ig-like domain-containing protein, partial [Gemmatimonadaceae bacterium]|nr:Ig-like domain-containing protein [Gemmatimonadaceae bacterium]